MSSATPAYVPVTYYVDNSSSSASDRNAGTSPDAPLKTLAGVQALHLNPGDTVAFKAGTSYVSASDGVHSDSVLTITASGTADHPITFTSYGAGDKPIIGNIGTGKYEDAIDLSNSKYVVLDGLHINNASHYGIGIGATSSHVTVQNMEINNVGMGLEVTGQNNLITANYIHDLHMITNTPTSVNNDDDYGATGIEISGSNNEASHNYIKNAAAPSYDYGTDGGAFSIWGTVSNVNIHDNWATNSAGFIEAGGMPGDKISNITLINNVSINDGNFVDLHNGGGHFGATIMNVVATTNTIVDTNGVSGAVQTVFLDAAPTAGTINFSKNVVSMNNGDAVFKQEGAYHSNNLFYLQSPGIHLYNDWNNKLATGEAFGNPNFANAAQNNYTVTAAGYTQDGATLSMSQVGGTSINPVVTVPPVQAISAQSFINSIGVNTHLSYWDTAWGVGNGQWAGATNKIMTELAYLGVNNIRDGAPTYAALAAEYNVFAKAGYHFDLLQTFSNGAPQAAADVASIAALNAVKAGAVVSYEGANEYNINNYTLNGVGSNGNLAWGLLDDQASRQALNTLPADSHVKLIAATTGEYGNSPNASAYVDASSYHVYAGVGQQLQNNLISGIANAQTVDPGAPVMITETGVSSSGYGSSNWGVTDEYTQGIIDTNAVFDSFKHGASMTYLYDLMNNNAAADQEDNFGLFNADGTAKAAGVDIHNLLAILADNGAGTVQPGTLAYTVAGLPSTASTMLLEKSNGTFELVIWNGNATVSDGTKDVTPATSNITVTFNSSHQAINIFDPMQGASAIQTLANAASVSVSLTKDPIIIELPAMVPPAVTISNQQLAHDTGASATDGITSNGAVTLTGTVKGAAGTIVTVMDGNTALGTATLDSNSGWTFATTLTAGTHALHAVATDIAGNITVSAAQSAITVDTAAPHVTMASETQATNSTNVTFAGTVSDTTAATVQVYNGNTVLGTANVNNGNWTYTATGLSSGSHSFSATAADVAGNTASSTAQTLIVQPIHEQDGPNHGDTAHGWYVINDVWNPGTLVYGQDYTISSTYNMNNLTSDVNFNWSFPVVNNPWPVVRAYPDVMFGVSPYGDTVNATDTHHVFPVQVGNISSLTADYNVHYSGNTQGFDVSFDIWFTNTPNGGPTAITNEVMVWLHQGGIAAYGSNVGTYTDATFSGGIYHTGTYTALISDTDLTSGTVDLAAMFHKLQTLGIVSANEYLAAIDLGAETVSGAGSLTINNLDFNLVKQVNGAMVSDFVNGAGTTETVLAPTISVTSQNLAHDTGASATDRVTSNGALTLTGTVTGASGTAVKIYDGSTVLGTATISGTAWNFTTTLAAGTHALHAVATDTAGQTASTGDQSAITVATTAPALTVASQVLAHDTGASAADKITNNGAVTLSGTVANAAGTTVQIYDGGTLLGNATVSGNTWSYAATLGSGSHALHALATDLAGNVTSSAVQSTITVDNGAPALAITAQHLAQDTGASATDNITSNGAVTLTGTVTDATATTVQILDGSSVLGNATVSNGTWSFTTTLSTGSHALYAAATDLAGNTTTSAAQPSITIETAPQLAITSQSVNGASLTMAGIVTNTAGTIVQILDDTALLGTAALNGSGGWTYSGTLGSGSHLLHAVATDLAGNMTLVNATSPILLNDPPAVAVAPAPVQAQDTLTLAVSEQAYLGDAKFTVSVDGHQVGGVQTVTALHNAGQSQDIVLNGDFGAGSHTVTVNFINDAWSGIVGGGDRNLFVDAITLNGTKIVENQKQNMSGAHDYTVTASPDHAATTATPDTLVLKMSESAYLGNAQFTVSVDGKQVGGVQTVTASHAASQSEDFVLNGDFGAGSHTVTVNFINDAWSGIAGGGDRNLFVDAITLDGAQVSENQKQNMSGAHNYTVMAGGNTAASSQGSVLYGDDGANAFVFAPTALGANISINNYHASTAINIADLLIGYNPTTSAIADFVSLTEKNGGTTISVDRDGSANAYHSEALAVLNGVTGLNVHDMLTHEHLIVS